MRRRICIFGDSITWGVEDSACGGWVDRLKAQKFSQDRLADVYNLGISADNTKDVLARINSEARARKCDMLIFAIGINDSQFLTDENRNMVPVKEFEGNIKKLITQGREVTSDITFVGLTKVDETKTTPVAWRETTHFTNKYIQQYDEIVRNVCEEEGVKYISMFDLLGDNELSDGLHPNVEGHKKMFERIQEET